MLTVETFLSKGRLKATVSEREFKNLLAQAGGSKAIKEDDLYMENSAANCKFHEEDFPQGTEYAGHRPPIGCIPWPGDWIKEFDGCTYSCHRIVLLQLTPSILVELTVTGPNYGL